MKRDTKLNLWALGIWALIMVTVFVVHGFPDLIWGLGCGWLSLFASGIIVMLMSRILMSKGDVRARSKYGEVPHGDPKFEMEKQRVVRSMTEAKGRALSNREIAKAEVLVAELISAKKSWSDSKQMILQPKLSGHESRLMPSLKKLGRQSQIKS